MGLCPIRTTQKGCLYRFIEATFVGKYAYEFVRDYNNIFKTFIIYGARINRQIFDLLFRRENQPMYLNDDLEEEYNEELEKELANSYQIKAYIIDIIATLYNEDNRVLSIDNELYQRLSHRRLFNLDRQLYNLLSQSDFARYTKSNWISQMDFSPFTTNSLINIVIDYSENILPLIYYTYTNWSFIYVVGDLDDIKALPNPSHKVDGIYPILPNYNILSYDTIRFMLLKYYSGYLRSI